MAQANVSAVQPPVKVKRQNKGKGFGYYLLKTLIYIFLVVLAVICLLPFLMMVINSTRSGAEIVRGFTLIPSTHTVDNWKQVFKFFNPFVGIKNSVLIAVPASLLSVYFSALTAYGLAFYKFKGNNAIFITILIFMMIPGQLSLIGFFNLCASLHLINTYVPLIVPAIASAGTVFFLRQYIVSSLPKALVEAARMEGASEFYIFNSIVIPVVSPAISTMGIMAFIGNWNNYLTPLILINDPKKMPLAVMITTLRSSTDLAQNQGAMYLGISVAIVPILLVFAFFSKYIISSVSAGAVKE